MKPGSMVKLWRSLVSRSKFSALQGNKYVLISPLVFLRGLFRCHIINCTRHSSAMRVECLA